MNDGISISLGQAFTQGALRFNTYLGLAAVGSLFGQAGLTLAALMLALMVPTVNVLSVWSLTAERGVSVRSLLLPIAKNPLILACLGGALVNLNGELIGINTAILAPDGGNIGIGFAIPSNMVKNLTAQMVQYGQVKRGELGIMGTELSSELAKAMKVDAQRGAFVSQVLPNSSAAKAGIKAGDVITSLNGKPISSFAALRAEVGSMPIGSKVTLGLLRDGKPVNVSLELQQSSQNQVDSSTIFSGIEGADMSNKGADKGVVVSNVKAGSPAARIGLKKGDVIIGVNRTRINNLQELSAAMKNKGEILAL